MPWKIAGKYVVNSDTGKRVNKTPKSHAQLVALLRALYANVPEAKK